LQAQGKNLGMIYYFLFFFTFALVPLANAKDVYFEIPAGTAENLTDWNDKANPVVAEVGDVLIITNLDSAPHRLHTDGRPCAHGEVMPANGGTWSCVLEKAYNALEEEEPTRDHFNYDLRFWIVVTDPLS
jgi:hypothetical protein